MGEPRADYSKHKNITVRQYADHRGVSPSTVSRWIKDGRIQRNRWGGLTPADCDARLAAAPPMKGGRRQELPDDASGQAVQEISAAKLRRAKADAKTAEMKARRMAGELVSRSAVRQQWADVGTTIREQLLQLPKLIAGELAAIQSPAAVERLLEDKIRDALASAAARLEASAEMEAGSEQAA